MYPYFHRKDIVSATIFLGAQIVKYKTFQRRALTLCIANSVDPDKIQHHTMQHQCQWWSQNFIFSWYASRFDDIRRELLPSASVIYYMRVWMGGLVFTIH